ncbi:hypothetical protein SAPIO_CDS10527 [Scedosporium apiospermum]|uniref:DUF1996 domain-containing protein n=1 Tax=Pseudallescheria apiosperma TaxID=563466 RepID=A0A084FVL9_PSEDA|nr:uncharacterized protein SAPIO_CDS10527 [Scedosporium apiospermum]KEZ39131.1 hypothetical protein SAPIO_CDS10527 [Scedosporium apiospermum]
MMLKSLVALATAQLAVGQELMRFGCSQLTLDRIDPLVNPGALPAPHMHQVIGGNSFNATMDPASLDPPRDSSCTTCTFAEDFSNYWTPNLYFRARNGTFKHVPIFANLGLGQIQGGMTVYYIRGYRASDKVTTFKPGFRMLVGDAANRDPKKVPRQLCYRCEHNYQQSPFGGAPCTGSDTTTFPKEACGGGWRVTITFPTCWDGKTLDTPNHQDHVTYTSSGSFETGGPCPASHPVKIPQVMYEIMFDTAQFNDPNDWPEDGSQPFVWAMGDTTGAGIHGDYLFGWKGDALQRAMDSKCNGVNCPGMERQSVDVSNQCAKGQMAAEPVGDDGWLTSLPGNWELS